MRLQHSRASGHTAILALIAILPLSACATTPPAAEEEEQLTGWRVRAAEHIALWYHGMAYALTTAAPQDTNVLPRYAPGYVTAIQDAKRRAGVYPTPLDQRAAEFGRIFRGNDVYNALQFLPLYFRSAEALYSGIDLWNRAGGNPYAAGTPEAAQVIAFLSQAFPRPAERQTVVEWVDLLREEDRLFYANYWAGRSTTNQTVVAEVQRAWDALAPSLSRYLNYIRFQRGELFLAPAIGPEGRSVTSGTITPRSAVLEPAPGNPGPAIWSFVHELLYPLVGDVIREQIAPARIRELGEDRITALAAVRGGAILLQHTAPTRVDEYRRFNLEATGRTVPTTSAQLETAFNNAFPIPPELQNGLERAITAALAGI